MLRAKNYQNRLMFFGVIQKIKVARIVAENLQFFYWQNTQFPLNTP